MSIFSTKSLSKLNIVIMILVACTACSSEKTQRSNWLEYSKSIADCSVKTFHLPNRKYHATLNEQEKTDINATTSPQIYQINGWENGLCQVLINPDIKPGEISVGAKQYCSFPKTALATIAQYAREVAAASDNDSIIVSEQTYINTVKKNCVAVY